TGGGHVVVPVRVGGCSTLGCEDVDDVRLGLVREVHHRADVLPPAFAAAVMHQDHRCALEVSANPALVRSELRDGLCVPVEYVAHVGLLSFVIPGVWAVRVMTGEQPHRADGNRFGSLLLRGSGGQISPTAPLIAEATANPTRPVMTATTTRTSQRVSADAVR